MTTGPATVHDVPYFSQWESPELVPEFITGARSAADDPLWPGSGAASASEFWARRLCGMACLRMALKHWRGTTPPSVPGRRHAVTACGNTLLCDREENPASGIGEWVFAAVDPAECQNPLGLVTPPEDLTPLLVDGAEFGRTYHYQTAGLHFRAIRTGYTGYYLAICPLGQEDQTQLVTR